MKSKLQKALAISRVMGTFVASAAFLSSQVLSPVGPDTSAREDLSARKAQAAPVSAIYKAPERIADYILGVDDQIVIHAFKVEELPDKPISITGDGYINLPLVGKVKAAGLSVSALENDLAERLKVYVKDPQVSILVTQFASQPVSVVGEVNNPGVQQLKGRKTLIEVIALSGGLKEDAGNTATITREVSKGQLPLPGAVADNNGRFSVARISLRDVMDGRDPNNNIVIETNDVIMIPKARLLYVVGEVQKPGGYVMNERNSVTVLQAVALAGGLTQMAAPKKAKILYQRTGEEKRTEVPTDVGKILDGKAPDVDLHAEDILFVPSNLPKSVGGKALQTAINMAGVAIWRF